MERAFCGVTPSMSSTIPNFITPDMTLQILDTMYRACRKVAFVKIEALRDQGIRIDPSNPIVVRAT
jgi:hypothetical protein